MTLLTEKGKPGRQPRKLTRRQALQLSGGGLVAASLLRVPPARAARSIIIGHQADLTGVLAYAGFWNDRVVKAAVKRVNEAGGIGGAEVVLVTDDTESDARTGQRIARKLIDSDKADFLIGSNHSGVAFSSIPIVKESKILYFPIARAREVTGDRGNRYVFRSGGNVAQEAQAMVTPELVKAMGKNWVLFFEDYSWGHSLRDEWTSRLKKYDAKITNVPTPLRTSDYVPYLMNIPKDTTAIFAGLLGADLVGFAQQFRDTGFASRIKAAAPMVTGITAPDAWANAKGFLTVAEMPVQLKNKNTEANKQFRQLIQMEDDGREVGGKRYPAENFSDAWEAISWIKRGVEKSGWKDKNGTADLIKALEGMSVEESVDFPQGNKTMRAEDHQVFLDHYVRRINEKGEGVIEHRVPAEECQYPVDMDLRRESI